MYSGGDSSGDGVNSRNQFNWQMTSQTSCNVNSGGVIDWASLAQQWIQMKDSGAGLPDTPPPPIISANSKSNKTTKFDEQGEADMEVEKEDEQQIVGFGQSIAPPQTENLNTSRWYQPTQDAVPYCPPQQSQWTSWPGRVALPPPALHVPITTGSLTPPMPKEIIASTTPPLQSIPNIPKLPNEMTSMLPNKESMELPPMDAAKRKILPAWIREGLEKMEREKLKQIEREQKDPSIAGTPTADNDINSKIKTMVKNSIMEMEGESSGNEAAEVTESPAPYDDADADRAAASATTNLSTASVPLERMNSLSGKTYEERMADMMIAVRKTLTELLLEVTNEEISSIAYEAIRKRRAKASSAQVIRKSAITSITGKLGLEAYADSDTDNSASDNDTNNDDSKRSDDEIDSEEELKANIRICKRAFAKTVEEIEERIQASAAREEMLLRERQRRDSRDHTSDTRRSPVHKSKGFDKEIGEPQPDKKSNSNGKRRKERTSRFSDNKDSRNRVATNYFPAPSISSGNMSSQAVPGSSSGAPINPTSAKHKVSNASASSILAAPLPNDKRPSSSYSGNKSSKPPPTTTSTSKRHRHSDSPSCSSDSTSSGTRSSHSRRSKYSATRHKRSSTERSKRSHRSSSYRSSRRRDSTDSNDNDRYKKHRQPTSTSSSLYSRRHDRRRSDSRSSRSRTRSRSRSRSTTYSSSRRTDRY